MSELAEKHEKESFQTDIVSHDSYPPAFPKGGDLDELEHLSKLLHMAFPQATIPAVAAHLHDYSVEESIEVIRQAAVDHADDVCIDKRVYQFLEAAPLGPLEGFSQEDWESAVQLYAFLIKDWSLYAEVRSATMPIDEEEQTCESLRVYFIGVFYACAGACLDTFFYARLPAITISSGALQLMVAGTGALWAWALPDWTMNFGIGKVRLNPGRWTFKEQTLATLTVSVSLGTPYCIDAITAMANDNFYNFNEARSYGYMILLILSTTTMGFGIAGLLRVFLVYNDQAVWYNTLPTIILNRTLVQSESRQNVNGWKLRRYEFLGLFALISFCFYWITNFVFQALTIFNWPQWIDESNVNLQAICGFTNGLGLNPIPTFDWNQATANAPLITPLPTMLNQLAGVLVSFIAIVIIWYSNARWTGYLPINSNKIFDNTGQPYQVAQILGADRKIDDAKFEAYSPAFYSAGNLVVYGAFFAAYPAMFVYAILNYSRAIIQPTKILMDSFLKREFSLSAFNDRFSRAVKKYKDVPEWWFLSLLVISLGLGIATVEHFKFTNTPVWTLFFSIGLGLIFAIPFGILYATTTIGMSVNVLFEMIIGYALAGNGNALLISKAYATNFLLQADNYVSNQKQSHYCAVPPRSLFRLQLLSVICVSFVQSGLIYWQNSGSIEHYCLLDPDVNRDKFYCQNTRTQFNASVLWGVIGPKRVFDQIYPAMKYCFLIGAVYPIPFWLIRRFFMKGGKNFWMRNTNEMIWLVGVLGAWAPLNWSYFLPSLYLCIFFNGYLRNYYHTWWTKYNYLLYNSMSVGISWAGLFMFFATSYHHIAAIDWWGNNVPFTNTDTDGTAVRLTLAKGETFGPRKWHA